MPLKDSSKLAATSLIDSVKNYNSVDSPTVTFSGTIFAGGSMVRSVTLPITRTEDTVTNLMYNYSGGPNDGAEWLQGFGPIIWGDVELDGGWGVIPIKVSVQQDNNQVTITFDAFNGDGVAHNIVSPVTVQVKAAFFAISFT